MEYSERTPLTMPSAAHYDELFSACISPPQALFGSVFHLYFRFTGFMLKKFYYFKAV